MFEKTDIPLPAVLNFEEIGKEYSKAEILINTLSTPKRVSISWKKECKETFFISLTLEKILCMI